MVGKCTYLWYAVSHQGLGCLCCYPVKLELFDNHVFLNASIAAHFILTSAQVFSCTDLVTDSKCFYTSILELLLDPDEKEEVHQLLIWWNRYGPSLYVDTMLKNE